MDRNQATGLILIAAMLLIYFTFFRPEPPVVEEPVEKKEQIVQENNTAPPLESVSEPVNDSARNILYDEQYGVFAAGATGEDKEVKVENEDVIIKFNAKGGQVTEVELKKFKTYNQEPLILFGKETGSFSLNAKSNGKSIDFAKLYYQSSVDNVGDSTRITFSLNLGGGKQVKQTYFLGSAGYELGYKLELIGLDSDLNNEDLVFNWADKLKLQEKDIKLSRQNTTVNYYTLDEGFDNLSESSTGLEEETVDKRIKWATIKQRFFLAGIIAENHFNKGKVLIDTDPASETEVKSAQITLSLPIEDLKSGKANYSYYFGPNDYHVTSEMTEEFSRNLYLGWPPMLWVNKYILINLFDLLNNFISNYGLIIIIMVFLIKLVLSPLSYKSYLSMAKMKVLKPELDEIKERTGGDAQKAQKEQMQLYQKVGVNPISGCVPLLLQMPIILSMFYFFPQSIELRQKSFLWAEDLSTYDAILSWNAHIPLVSDFYGNHISLFVLLMTVSTILITYSQQQVSTVQGPMKSMSYMMPVIFMFVLNSYPAALSFYYFISNLVTFGQQALIRKFVDEDKIRTILEENKKKNVNKKKSKFQQRLEEAMKTANQNKAKK